MSVNPLPFDPGVSGWNAIAPQPRHYPELDSERIVDWLVIGAGFAGLSAVRRLQQLHPDDTIILLEARRVAQGPAGRNSGFMIDLPHNLASKDYAGAIEKDQAQTKMNRKAISFAQAVAQEFEFPNEAIRLSGKINAAATDKGDLHNRDFATHLDAMGEIYESLDAAQMQAICGSSYYSSGLFMPGTAMIQPALYISQLARAVSEEGALVLENSPVVSLSNETGNWEAITPKGKVEANKTILAVNGHAESFGYFKRRLMHVYLYASMTRPLTQDEHRQLGGDDNWALTPAEPLGTTVRKISTQQGPRIVVRNRFTWAQKRQIDPTKMNAINAVHARTFKARFPMLPEVAMEYIWGGLLCLSRNGVSAFGEIEKNLFSACCQNGLGTARGTLNGILAAEQASGISSSFLDTVLAEDAPQKLPPEPFSSIGANTYMRWGEFKAGAEL